MGFGTAVRKFMNNPGQEVARILFSFPRRNPLGSWNAQEGSVKKRKELSRRVKVPGKRCVNLINSKSE